MCAVCFNARSIWSMIVHLLQLKAGSTLLFSEAKENSLNEHFQGVLRSSVQYVVTETVFNVTLYQYL